MINHKNLSDKELYKLCKDYGLRARVWRRRFAGLLPEVLERRLYKKRGYTSIHEFAGKLAGMSKEAVDKVLCLSKKLADKPLLRDQLISGEQGWSKIARVAYIATPETDGFWAEKVSTMPKLALEAYIQAKEAQDSEQNNRLKLVPGHDFQPEKTSTLTFHLHLELEKKFRMYKYELEKERKEPLTWENTLEALLERKSFASTKMQIQICPTCIGKMNWPEKMLQA